MTKRDSLCSDKRLKKLVSSNLDGWHLVSVSDTGSRSAKYTFRKGGMTYWFSIAGHYRDGFDERIIERIRYGCRYMEWRNTPQGAAKAMAGRGRDVIDVRSDQYRREDSLSPTYVVTW